MAFRRWILAPTVCCIVFLSTGCASLEDLRQAQMANRNLIAEKAQNEQDLYDLRTTLQSLRSRSDSLEDQIATKDQLVTNLQSENDALESNVRQAQRLVKQIVDTPLAKPVLTNGSLPPDLDLALKELADRYAHAVHYDSAHGAVKWTSDLVFALGSDVVKNSALESLRQFSQIMKSPAAEGFDVVVVGHTDDVRISKPATRQKHPTNWHLSVHRAIAVGTALLKDSLEPTRVGVMGFGQYKPLVPNDSEENRARNRRVEMYIVPTGTFAAGAITPSSSAVSFTGKQVDETTK